jgi:hypothetical protein
MVLWMLSRTHLCVMAKHLPTFSGLPKPAKVVSIIGQSLGTIRLVPLLGLHAIAAGALHRRQHLPLASRDRAADRSGSRRRARAHWRCCRARSSDARWKQLTKERGRQRKIALPFRHTGINGKVDLCRIFLARLYP